jgi:hypothetical protein
VVVLTPRSSISSLPKIVAKMNRKISGNITVKKTDAGLRQKTFWSKRN